MTARIVQLPWQELGEPDSAFRERLEAYREAKGWTGQSMRVLTPEERQRIGPNERVADGDAMPIDIPAYLERTMHLNTEQHGAYFRLIMHAWSHGFLPNDAKQLSAIVGVQPFYFSRKIASVVMPFFTLADDGRLYPTEFDGLSSDAEQPEGSAS